MYTRVKKAVIGAAVMVALAGGSIAVDVGIADAHGDHTNPCGGVQIGINGGRRYYLYNVSGGYDYSWNQGWLIVWYQGTPYQVYWPYWEGWGC